ncbi:hypothetical protein F4820DRAFT_446043 [Hypoxylon rubiginosum]|uniref:Uncharacterized protein n=1 Tax=Hypoxylon rubiginosum TaxID=110542 RepID=A0ACB9Z6T7_9PEZI|nr:hypothetical protein F4820DRAFT_446043 [Hypoxylon rubiginosum]
MESIVLSLINVCYILLLGAEAVGSAYFASVINQELRPYFDAHGMQSEAADARQAFGYLVAAVVLLGLSFLGTLVKVGLATCGCDRLSDDSDDSDDNLCVLLVSYAAYIILLVFTCLTAAHAWGWWKYFAAEGLDHLAASCLGLAAMIIACLVLSLCTLIVLGVVKRNCDVSRDLPSTREETYSESVIA